MQIANLLRRMRYGSLLILLLTTHVAHGQNVVITGAAMAQGAIIDNAHIAEENILEFSINPNTTRVFCYPALDIATSCADRVNGRTEGYRIMHIKSSDADITFPDLPQRIPNEYVYKTNEYSQFNHMESWLSTNPKCLPLIDPHTACWVYSPADLYRLKISAPGKPDGIYESTFYIFTYYNTANSIVAPLSISPSWGHTAGTITYRVSNGSVVPPTTPVSCNFSRIYTDSSGNSSGTIILHSYGDMKPGATGSKDTALVYTCDQEPASFTAYLNKAGISIKGTTAGAHVGTTKTVVDDGTGKLDVSLGGYKGPLPVYTLSGKEFLINFRSSLTTKSAGMIEYTDVLVLSYD